MTEPPIAAPLTERDIAVIEALLDRCENPGGTHYAGCFANHLECAAARLLADRAARAAELVTAEAAIRSLTDALAEATGDA